MSAIQSTKSKIDEPTPSLVDSVKIERAFQVISANCNLTPEESNRLLTSPKAVEKIASLSRTSPENQRHRVQRFLVGENAAFDKRTVSTVRIYETVKFGEVPSRLHRALGLVRKEVEYLGRKIADGVRADRLADRVLTLDLIAERASTLRGLLLVLEEVPEPKSQKSGKGKPPAKVTSVKGRLYAAVALGFVSKNAHDVAELHPEHRPTTTERHSALSLCDEVLRLAVAGRDAAWKAFGRADDDCRVRTSGHSSRRVITHGEPDGDAVVSAWLAERFLFAEESVEVLLVPRGRVLGAYCPGDCLVDVGNTHDPEHFLFDHKPPAFPSRHDSCAALLVWQHLVKLGQPVARLENPLIRAVFARDSARQRSKYKTEYRWSFAIGVQAALDKARQSSGSDAEVYRTVRDWLDANCGNR